METTRQQKISRLLQKELGLIFQREANTLFPGKMVTVTSVKITPDLSIARAYLSIFPSSDANKTLKHIVTNTKAIRLLVGKQVKNQLRIVPDFDFHIDDSLDYIQRIDELLKK